MRRSGVLVMSTLGVGDILLAQPLLAAVRRARHDRLVVLARAGSPAQLARRFGLADVVVPYVPRWPHRIPQGARLALWILRTRFNLVLTTAGMNPYYSACMAIASGAPLRIGERRGRLEWAWTEAVDVCPDSHVTARNQALGRAAGVDAGLSPHLTPSEPEMEHARGLLGAGPCHVAVTPGSNASISHKRWPLDRFAQLAIRLRNAGVHVVLLGGPDERDMGARLVAEAGPSGITDLIGATDVGTAAAALALCRVAVGNDGMLLHLAAAVGTPTVAIFGPSNPSVYRPVDPCGIVVRKDLPCAPCDGRRRGGCLERPCLMGIEVGEIEESVRALLERSDAPTAREASR